MPRRNSCITGTYSCPARNHVLPRDGIVHLKINIYPSTSTEFFNFDKSTHQKEHKRRYQVKLSALHQISFMLTSHEEYIEDCIANTRHKFYFLHVKSIELSSNVEENN